MTISPEGISGEHWGEFAKSTFSAQTACVEVAMSSLGNVKVRDSKHADSPVLAFDRDEWTAFLKGVLDRQFDLPG